MDEQIVTIGGELKALGDGRVGGHLVKFGTSDETDLVGDFFASDTYYGPNDKAIGWVHHRLPMKSPKTGRTVQYKQRLTNPVHLTPDDVGVFAEVLLDMRNEYEAMLYQQAEKGILGWSSGTAPHVVEREPQPNGASKITVWPLGDDASLTAIPAEPRIRVTTLKTYLDMAEPYVKALLPQADAVSAAADATDSQPDPEPTLKDTDEVKTTMDNEQMQAMIDAAVAKSAEATTKAIMDKLAAEPATNPLEVETKTQPAKPKEKPEAFKSFGEQLLAIAKATTPGGYVDRRLYAIKASAPSGMNESIGSEGGFLVQQDFATDLFSQAFGQSQLMQRCTPVPISGNANGTKIVLIDETDRGNGNRWGGIQMYWRAEAGTVTKSQPSLREVVLDLKDLMGIAYASQQSLDDAAQLESLIGTAFADEVVYKTEDALVNGVGAGTPLGVMNAGCLISVAKEVDQAADTLIWENVVKMWSRLHPRFKTNAVWLISPDVFPQMASMSLAVGTGGVPVYMPAGAASTAPYGTLFGRPVFEVEYAAKVGDKGDILLADWSQYYLASKGGMRFNSSMHVRFLYDEMTFRMTYRADGQPKFASALTPANDGPTLGAFVTLDAR